MHKTMALALSVAVTALPTAPAAQSRHEPDASLVRNGKIAFAQDASIMLLDPDVPGRPQRVGRGFEPAWSPDGRTIAFTDRISPTAQTLFLMNADGGDRHRFPLKAGGRNDLSNYLPAWSPDGKRLAFTRSVAAPRTSSGWRVDVYIVDVDGTHLRRLTTSGSAYSATWSPDGRQVAYLGLVGSSESSRRLHVVNADGSNDRTLLSASRASWAPGGHTEIWPPAWSPDGRQIAFSRSSEQPTPYFEIHLINADGTGLHRLGRMAARKVPSGGHTDNICPAWSPDGKQIVFAGHPNRIQVVNTDGNGLHTLLRTRDIGRFGGTSWQPLP